ncbi:hypothetical protein ACFLSV_02305 [Bacteroidota bacterium]
MRHSLKITIAIIFIVLFSEYSLSQDRIVIISEKVGEMMDSNEKESYSLFTNYKDFKSAVFYRSSEGKYYVRVICETLGNITKDTVIHLGEASVFRAALRVEYYKDIVEGIHPKNPKYSLDTLNNKYYVRISNVYKDVLPFVDPIRKRIPNPLVGFDISLFYVSPDLSSVESFFKEAENSFRREGWNIPKNNLNFNVSTMYSFNLYIEIYKTLGIEIETGKSIGPDIELWYSVGFLRYGFDIEKLPSIRPYISAGIGKHSYFVEATYNNAIVSSGGAYLERISSEGGKVGYFFKAGSDFWLPTEGGYFPLCLNAFATYSYIPEIVSTYYGYTTKVKLGGFRFGAGLRIYF